jgi:hypothetical protein
MGVDLVASSGPDSVTVERPDSAGGSTDQQFT